MTELPRKPMASKPIRVPISQLIEYATYCRGFAAAGRPGQKQVLGER